MSVDFSRRKRGPGARDPNTLNPGRLCVGWRLKDWTKVYYEPIIKDNEGEAIDPNDDEEPEMGLYRKESGDAQKREPLDSEIFWFAHFDVANQPSKVKKHREALQKRFLYDAWRYCAATDPVKIKEMEVKYRDTDPLDRHWQSWFEEAKKWKKTKSKIRAVNRKNKEDDAVEKGLDPKDVDIDSDDSDDSGYVDNGGSPAAPVGPMGPPPRPPPRPSTGSTGKKRKNTTGTSGRSSPATKYIKAHPMMTGAGGRSNRSRAGTMFSDSSEAVLGRFTGTRDDDSDDEDDAVTVTSESYELDHPPLTSRNSVQPSSQMSSHSSRLARSQGHGAGDDEDEDGEDGTAGMAAASPTRPRAPSNSGGAAAGRMLTPPSTRDQGLASQREPTPSTPRRRLLRGSESNRASEDANGHLTPFNEWADNKQFKNKESSSSLFVSQDPNDAEDAEDEEEDDNITLPGGDATITAINGVGLSEEAAFAEAIRRSAVPEENLGGNGVDDDDDADLREAIRRSEMPEENLGSNRVKHEQGGEQEDVVQSIEAGAGGGEMQDDGFVEGGEE